jgi:hypothetical protein
MDHQVAATIVQARIFAAREGRVTNWADLADALEVPVDEVKRQKALSTENDVLGELGVSLTLDTVTLEELATWVGGQLDGRQSVRIR